MIDILLLTLPADHVRAARIADALVERGVAGPHRTRFVSAHPADPDWQETVTLARDCPCVIFCWSRATVALHIAPMRALYAELLSKDQAIAVELDSGTRPDSNDGCSTYPFHGWRSGRGWAQQFVFGSGFATQIVVAAQQKVLGRDPPPPGAYRHMIRRQAWVLLVAIASTLSVFSTLLGLWTFSDFAKWRDGDGRAAFENARKAGDCEALRKFDDKSAWYGDASRLEGTCKEREVKGFVERPQTLTSLSNTNTAQESERMTREMCQGFEMGQAKLIDVRITYKGKQGVLRIGDAFTCIMNVPASKSVETMGGRAP